MKKWSIFAIILMLIPALTTAQSRVRAEDILQQINDEKAVHYTNAVIEGDLDLTSLKDWTPDKNNRKNSRWNTQTFWHHVRSSMIFIDCTFNGDVTAYHHDEWKNETRNVIFHEDTSFSGCRFREDSAFKYVRFEKGADFKGTSFSREALFKYTGFSGDVSFAGASFGRDANFKYTRFPDFVSFNEAEFRREANFKYTKFPRGVSFKNAAFKSFANFKYSKFSDPFDFDGTEFDGDIDLKYTKLNGRSFNRYLLQNRK